MRRSQADDTAGQVQTLARGFVQQRSDSVDMYASDIVCTVAGDKKVKYKDQLWSLTGLAKELLHTDMALAGPKFFKYNGEWLNDFRHKHQTI